MPDDPQNELSARVLEQALRSEQSRHMIRVLVVDEPSRSEVSK